jgi:N-acylneuraminate cytidylyltransferase
MSNLAIIPARGGSKRIPKKNIKDFLGKPIIAYSIETALKSGLFDEIIVSTDDPEISDVAIKYGAKVPCFRSSETSNDFASLSDVMNEVILFYKNRNIRFDYVCCILPTTPLVTMENLKLGYGLITNSEFDSIRPIVRYSYPIQRAFRYNKNGGVELFNPEHLWSRSQDLEPAYHDAGQFYWFYFEKGLTGTNRGAFIIPEKDVQDIDTLEDWDIAELKYKMRNESKL